MKLYLIHCGYYDQDVSDGIYEMHTNFFVVSNSSEGARAAAKSIDLFKAKKMHVDGVQEIEAVQGFRISLTEDAQLRGQNLIMNVKHRDLASRPTA